MEIILRQATLGDVPVLAEMNRMLRQDELSPRTKDLAWLTERMQEWITNQMYTIVVMERGDEIIGYASFRSEVDLVDPTQQNLFLRQFFIKPVYRRRGIGHAMFNRVEKEFFPQGVNITLEVLNGNIQGRSFWEALGFEAFSVTYRRANDQ
ncbi:MAG: GNAT family N-acetyltransferase [Phototrophicaceae bacterium]